MKLFFSFGARLKAVECMELTEEGLKDKFKEVFSVTVPLGRQIVVKAFDKDADDFVEIDEDFLISIAQHTKLSFQLIDADGDDLSIPGDDGNDDPNVQENSREACGGRPLPVAYQLPDFGYQINLELAKKRPVTLSVKQQIVGKLYQDMLQYCKDFQPTTVEVQRVVETLLRDHPFLQDKKVLTGGKRMRDSDDSTMTYKGMILRRFKTAREKHANNPKYPHLQKLQKYNHNKNKSPEEMANGVAIAVPFARPNNPPDALPRMGADKRIKGQPPRRFDDGESEETAALHISKIKEEWEKPNKNLDVIKARMLCTASVRWFQLREMSVKQVQAIYPNLTDYSQWMEEFEFRHGKALAEVRDSFLTHERVQLLYKLILECRKGEGYASSLGAPSLECLRDVVLGCFPKLCSESIDSWIVVNKDVTTRDPVLQAVTKPGGNYFFHNATWFPYMDGVKLVEEDTLQLREAVDVLVAAIHLMNAEYPKRLRKTWRNVCETVYGIPGEGKPTCAEVSIATVICQDL